MAQITDFDEFLEVFDNGEDISQYTVGKSQIVGKDWFAGKLAENSSPVTVVELPTQVYKVAYEKAGANNMTVSQFLSKLLTGKAATALL